MPPALTPQGARAASGAAARAPEDGEMIAELSDAESKLITVLSTAIAMLQSLMAKITSRMTNKPAGADDADLEKLSVEYVNAVKRLHEILDDKLSGRSDKLTYRPMNRSCYGPLLDLKNTADSVVVVHDELSDLKAYLQSVTKHDQMETS